MTARSVPEWFGATPDTPVPPRVRLRTFDRKDGRCGICGRKIAAGEAWTCEHVVALVNGGENRELNLGVTCSWCLPKKNAADVAEKAKVDSVRKKHLGLAKSKCGFRKPPDGYRYDWRGRRYVRVEL